MANEIVITGASGFVGQALMKTFKKNGFLVTGLSRKVMSGLTTVNNYYDILMTIIIILHITIMNNSMMMIQRYNNFDESFRVESNTEDFMRLPGHA
jgi:short-subunit dehydrogenase